MVKTVLLKLIRGYQTWISPGLGHHCRFFPSCSSYCYQAIALYGSWKGAIKCLLRLLRCHPLHPGGYDPVVPDPGPRGLK